MIKRIFISTNETLHGLFNFDNDNFKKLLDSQLSELTKYDVLYYNGKTFDTSSKSSNIIVISDASEKQLTSINPDTDLLLHHAKTREHIDRVVNKFEGKKVQGEHPNVYYTAVFKIIFNDKITDKLSEILKVLGFTDKEVQEKEVLESKLNFLHLCLTPDRLTKQEVTKSEWTELSEFEILKNANDGPFGDKYIEALRNLRDKLLAPNTI